MRDEDISVTPTALRKITPGQRDFLISHVNGPRRIIRQSGTDGRRDLTVSALIRMGLIRTDPVRVPFPTHTVLTELGRAFSAHILAEYAEALVAAGFLHGEAVLRPMEVLRSIKHRLREGGAPMEILPHFTGQSSQTGV